MNDHQAIQEQLSDAHEAAHHLTTQDERDYEREMNQWFDTVWEDQWEDFVG